MKQKLGFIILAILPLILSCNTNNAVKMVGALPIILPPAQITSSADGGQAVSQVNQAKDLAYNSTVILKSLGDLGLKILTAGPAPSGTPTTVSCTDYGMFSYTGTASNMTLTFNLCRMNGFQFDGTYILQGTAPSFTVTLGSSSSAFRIVDFNDSSYSAITGTMILEGLRFTMAGASTASGEQFTLTTSGKISSFDYVLLREFTVTLTNLASNYTSTIDPATNDKATTVLTNGSVTQNWVVGGMSLTYTDLLISKVELFSATTPTGPVYSSSDTTVNGTTAFSIVSGVSGIMSVTTSAAAPIHHNYSTGLTSAGTMTVSAVGAAVAAFNAPGDIDVAVSPDAPVTFTSEYFLNHAVKFFSMEQVLPAYQGKLGTAPTAAASGTTWPATMTVTALSSAPTKTDLNCYTDVHVNYYSPADYAIAPPVITWYIDYHVSDSCVPPSGIPFEQALNITTPDNSCDVGLDINASATDITSGGVEHYTASTMPDGYYVISINNWNCQTTVSNSASIIIGDYLFGPYNCTYSSVSADGTDPGAWCRIADLRMTGGSVDVLAPDSTIVPWHP